MRPIFHAECTVKMASDWTTSPCSTAVNALTKIALANKTAENKLSRPNLDLTVKYAQVSEYITCFLSFVDSPADKQIIDVMRLRELDSILTQADSGNLDDDAASDAEKRYVDGCEVSHSYFEF